MSTATGLRWTVWRQSIGRLTQRAVAQMSDELPWFQALSAQDRSWIGLVAGRGYRLLRRLAA